VRFEEYRRIQQQPFSEFHRDNFYSNCVASQSSNSKEGSVINPSERNPEIEVPRHSLAESVMPDLCKFHTSLIVGAELKKRLKVCANEICQYTSAGTEENFWSRRKKNKNTFIWLCKVCSDAFKNNQFCDFCKQVYFQGDSNITDGKEWVQCDKCTKWNHNECEISANPDSEKLLEREDYKYFCVTCAKKEKRSPKNCVSSEDEEMSEEVKEPRKVSDVMLS